MAFKLAGQNPAVEALVYRPSNRSEVRTLELRPGMDGFSGPPTLETIGPYNPSEDRSEVIPLVARNSDSMDWWMDEIPKTFDPKYQPYEGEGSMGSIIDEIPRVIDPQYLEIGGKGGSPYQPYEGDGMPPAFPRPKPARMAGEDGGIIQLIASLLLDQRV